MSVSIIRANLDKPWDWYYISSNKFNHHEFFQTRAYREKETHKMLFTIKEELISKACHPKRILWYDENISTDTTHPLYSMTQKDIDAMYNL